uniref:Uncharacterized protein n=1 Tax=Zea mays TaxID=4577 RepID=C4J3E9_MAIZE|nr:unknown [Zea mays]
MDILASQHTTTIFTAPCSVAAMLGARDISVEGTLRDGTNGALVSVLTRHPTAHGGSDRITVGVLATLFRGRGHLLATAGTGFSSKGGAASTALVDCDVRWFWENVQTLWASHEAETFCACHQERKCQTIGNDSSRLKKSIFQPSSALQIVIAEDTRSCKSFVRGPLDASSPSSPPSRGRVVVSFLSLLATSGLRPPAHPPVLGSYGALASQEAAKTTGPGHLAE